MFMMDLTMSDTEIQDVPSPIDLRLLPDAQEWEQSALSKRPWRTEFFERFSEEINLLEPSAQRVLELGSGPGFLAKHLLATLNEIDYVLLDFSPAMHTLAKQRLDQLAQRAEFVERSFRDARWTEGLGHFDVIVTNQAVHELRHKRHAPSLHTQAKELLKRDGVYLVCDHFVGEGGMKNDQLYMTVKEQHDALISAGFESVTQLLLKGGLVLHKAK